MIVPRFTRIKYIHTIAKSKWKANVCKNMLTKSIHLPLLSKLVSKCAKDLLKFSKYFPIILRICYERASKELIFYDWYVPCYVSTLICSKKRTDHSLPKIYCSEMEKLNSNSLAIHAYALLESAIYLLYVSWLNVLYFLHKSQ